MKASVDAALAPVKDHSLLRIAVLTKYEWCTRLSLRSEFSLAGITSEWHSARCVWSVAHLLCLTQLHSSFENPPFLIASQYSRGRKIRQPGKHISPKFLGKFLYSLGPRARFARMPRASPPSHPGGGNHGRDCHDVGIVVVSSASLAPRSALLEDLSPGL